MTEKDRLLSFRGVLAKVPVGERALRRVITELGFKPAPGRRDYWFRSADVEIIVNAIAAHRIAQPATHEHPLLTTAQKRRHTQALAASIRSKASEGN